MFQPKDIVVRNKGRKAYDPAARPGNICLRRSDETWSDGQERAPRRDALLRVLPVAFRSESNFGERVRIARTRNCDLYARRKHLTRPKIRDGSWRRSCGPIKVEVKRCAAVLFMDSEA
jgi:hypothetical protein